MIKATARLSIRLLGLDEIQCVEYQPRYIETLTRYMQLLRDHPGEYAGLLFVAPSDTHVGMFTLLDGHHKFCASIMEGRRDAMCVVKEEATT